jgi:hypothetical protein
MVVERAVRTTAWRRTPPVRALSQRGLTPALRAFREQFAGDRQPDAPAAKKNRTAGNPGVNCA